MPRLFIFNPETDFARAQPATIYTPTKKVSEMKRAMALQPALMGSKGDFVLLPDEIDNARIDSLADFDKILRLGIIPAKIDDVSSIPDLQIVPWGWDFSVISMLRRHGVAPQLLPTDEMLRTITSLSHRRTTIEFHKRLCSIGLSSDEDIPAELSDIDSISDYLSLNLHCYLKAPWSSSGRGVVSADSISYDKVMQWARGTLRRQGSILAEPAWDKTLDFATEWDCDGGKALFAGYSVFTTAATGQYCGNMLRGQAELKSIINQSIDADLDGIVAAQKEIIDQLIAPHYSGPLDIDMLADRSRRVNACVEINLRLTMGRIALERFARFGSD